MKIAFRPSKEVLRYKVKIDTYNQSSKPVNNTLTYFCEVQQKKETMKGYVVNFRRYNVLLNNTKIHGSMNEIALISGELLYDLDLEISQNGEILRIKNLEEIRKKWEKIRYKLEYTYLGDIVTSIIEGLEKNVMDEKRFIASLNKDPFFYNYLNDVYGNYEKNRMLFEGNIVGFANINTISFTKKSMVKEDYKKKYFVEGKADLGLEMQEALMKAKNTNSIDFSLNTTHNLNSERLIMKIEVNQFLMISNALSANLRMKVELENEIL